MVVVIIKNIICWCSVMVYLNYDVKTKFDTFAKVQSTNRMGQL